MAIIPQQSLFSWKEIENLADLQRFSLLLKYLPDERLMRQLESLRGHGRNDYPVRGIWNSLLAGIVYQHPSIESLRRELMRNAPLRQLCGFDVCKGIGAVPSSNAYTNFLTLLMGHMDVVDAMFYDLVDKLTDVLPGFGKTLAIDSKAIGSRSRRESKHACPDGRGEADADKGVKTYKGKRKDGSLWESVKSWFGFKRHLIVDADYDLPVDYCVTKASSADITGGRDMLAELAETRPEILENADYWLGDKGYDDTTLMAG